MSYIETTKNIYREAAITPQEGFCCTTTPIWKLPGFEIHKIMQQMKSVLFMFSKPTSDILLSRFILRSKSCMPDTSSSFMIVEPFPEETSTKPGFIPEGFKKSLVSIFLCNKVHGVVMPIFPGLIRRIIPACITEFCKDYTLVHECG